MRPIQLIYRLLRQQRDPAVDRAMAAALPTADATSARYLALSLLERHQPEGMRGLIQHFHLMPPDVQATVVAMAGEMYRPLREATATGQTHLAGNAIEIITRSRRARLTYLASDRLVRGPANLRPAAAQCLLHVARWVRTDSAAGTTPRVNGQTASFLVRSVEEAVASYGTHYQQPVLLALATLSPRPMLGATRCFADWHHPVIEPMRRLLERPPDPAMRRLLLVALGLPTLMNAALAGIMASVQADQLGQVLETSHLLLVPAVQRNMLRLGDPDRLWPSPQQVAQMPPYQSRPLARWVMALPLEPSERVTRLAMLNRSSDPPTRLAALRQLVAMGQDAQAELWGVPPAVCGYASDTDPAIARIAVRHLIRHKWKGLAQLLLKLVNTGQPEVQQLASHYLSSVGFDRLWNAWPRLEVRQQLAAGQAMIKIDPYFHKHLGQRLSYMDKPTRLRALGIIHTLNQGHLFEEALIALTQDKDEVIASAAVKALGTTDSPRTIQTLQHALEHDDSRVRANAIEALEQVESTEHLGQLIQMAQEDDPRPRANAIGALLSLRADQAIDALVGMLGHTEAGHRHSALWLVEQLGLIEVARQVAEMSLDDTSPQVRARANKAVHHLMGLMAAQRTPAAAALASLAAAEGGGYG